MQFLVDILPLGSESVDSHIFADQDPESQNLADPADPDPMHCSQGLQQSFIFVMIKWIKINHEMFISS